MALRQIVYIGDDILRSKAHEVKEFNERLWTLLDDMAETMRTSEGVGLAAPQIGILRRVVVVDVGDGLVELINPRIVKTSGEQIDLEGCLSVPDRHATIRRPDKVTVEAFDRYGKKFKVKGEGFKARAFCHELDHLDGVLYVDLIEPALQGKHAE